MDDRLAYHSAGLDLLLPAVEMVSGSLLCFHHCHLLVCDSVVRVGVLLLSRRKDLKGDEVCEEGVSQGKRRFWTCDAPSR